MNPEFLDSMSWEMAEVYGAITDQILVNLAKYFPYYNAGNAPKSAFTYQAQMLAQMGQVNRETVKIIRQGLKDANSALEGILEQAIIDSVKKAEKPLWQAVKNGIYMPPQTPILSPNQYRAFQLYYKQASNKLNMVNTVMLESTQQAYRNTVADIAARVQVTQTALDIGAGETITGVSTWNQAVKHSIDRMKENGITGFIDHAGHRWSAEAYTSMDIRTTVYNTSRAAVWETNQNFGNDLYLVSYHNGARPLCYPWQNKVISSTNNARVVTDLDGNEIQVYAQSDTSYGMPAGLFGINCKHYPTPFIPGISVIEGQPQSEEANAKSYAESQEQRRLERKLREEKRDLMMAKAQGAPEDEIKALRAKCRQTSDDIDTFCEETGRARRQNREAVYTQREFPDTETYNVKDFVREQKEQVETYFENGGAQTEFPVTRIFPNYEDVGREYREFSEPGSGVITREHGKRQHIPQHEIDIANEIRNSIGGSVTHIDNAGQESKRDLIWQNKTWEVKQASSVNAAFKRTRIGMEQIAKTGGNLMIDLMDDDFDASFDSMLNGLKRYAPKNGVDVVVLKKGKVNTIIRYKKK